MIAVVFAVLNSTLQPHCLQLSANIESCSLQIIIKLIIYESKVKGIIHFPPYASRGGISNAPPCYCRGGI